MSANQRRGGTLQFKINGTLFDAKGSFSYSLGGVKREAIVGSGGISGFKETPIPAYVEGGITDSNALDLKALLAMTDETVTLILANGKTVSWAHAWYAAEGKVETEEGNIEIRFEAARGVEI